jgi:HK97 family phage major capsid protein
MGVLTRDEFELLPDVVYDEIIEEALPKRIGRSICDYQRVTEGDQIRVIKEGTWPGVAKVAEGAEIPLSGVTYDQITVTFDKYGYRFGFTREMLEDADFPLMRRWSRKVGQKMGLKETAVILSGLVDNAGFKEGGGGAIWSGSRPVNDILKWKRKLEENDRNPDALVLSPRLFQLLLQTDEVRHAEKFGSRDPITKQLVPNIYGLDVYVTSMLPSGTGLILEKDASILFERRPITVERNTKPEQDTEEIVVTQRYAHAVVAPSGILVFSGV